VVLSEEKLDDEDEDVSKYNSVGIDETETVVGSAQILDSTEDVSFSMFVKLNGAASAKENRNKGIKNLDKFNIIVLSSLVWMY